MPASTFDPVNAALRTALSKSAASNGSLDAQIAGSTKKALLANIEFEPAGSSYQSTVLDKLKSKYIVLKAAETTSVSSCKSTNSTATNTAGGNSSTTATSDTNGSNATDATLGQPRHILYPLQSVQLGWSGSDWTVGAGMVNMGNTCYLNSTLQALFHVPALVNWLVADREHAVDCDDMGTCIICAMCKTLQESQKRDSPTIRPHLVVNKLRLLCRNFIPGRQEDAHEFLRYLVEAMEKSYLNRFKNQGHMDARTKETTPLNQILGGYLRSAVRCLQCCHISTTFQHFQDLLLDIRKAQTLEEALDAYFAREKLDDESYHCEACQKKVPATKQFSLERAPMVLCIQLKRFSVTNNKISKHLQFRQRLDLTRYSRSTSSTPPTTTQQRNGTATTPLVYRLVAMVTHMGPAVSCGHYTAVAQTPCDGFYQFDDSMVRPISHQAVFNTHAYIMFYELETAPFGNTVKAASCTVTSGALLKQQNGYTSAKVYGPELPPKLNGVLASVNSIPERKVAGVTVPAVAVVAPATVTSGSKVVGSGAAQMNGSKLVVVGKSTSASGSSSALPTPTTTSTIYPTATIIRPIPTTPTKKPPLTPAPITTPPLRPTPTTTSTNSHPPPLTPAPNLINTAKHNPAATILSRNSSAFTAATSKQTSSASPLKLVPYDDDDDDEDDEDEEEEEEEEEETNSSSSGSKGSTPERLVVSTKATSKDWQVVGEVGDVTPARLEYGDGDGKTANGGDTSKSPFTTHAATNATTPSIPSSSNTTTDILRMGGHSGYGQPVASWSGARSNLDREVAGDRRAERKRSAEDDPEEDGGRVKQARKNGNSGSGSGGVWGKSNPGYNPIQEYHNAKNWSKQSGTYNRSFYSSNKHRNNNRRNFHQKNGYHNKNRYRP